MEEIKLKIYQNKGDYPKNEDKNKSGKIKISKCDLKRHAITIGVFSNYQPSLTGANFYQSFVDMALDNSNNVFIMNNDYKNAEESIQRTITFFLGMIAAKVVAESKYRIPNLFHLKDPNVTVKHQQSGNRKKYPDFFGEAGGKGYLFEAKGTKQHKFEMRTLTNAENQLNSIKSIEYAGTLYSKLRRYIVGSSFEDINKELEFCSIDPEEPGRVELLIDIDKMVFNYYLPIKQLLNDSKESKNNSEKCKEVVDNKEYILVNIGSVQDNKNGYIGMNQEILKKLNEFEEEEREGLYREIKEVISKEVISKEVISKEVISKEQSIGLDGIIYFEK